VTGIPSSTQVAVQAFGVNMLFQVEWTSGSTAAGLSNGRSRSRIKTRDFVLSDKDE
jgi:hypothetical protein